jgi:HAD superfamily hydrolase (TIGR01450 family)
VAVVVDLDGVIWLAEEPIEGGARAVELLRRTGRRVVFLTNNSFPSKADLVAKLGRAGIDCPPEDVISSAEAAAGLLRAGSRALVVGGPGVVEALAGAGVESVPASSRAPGDLEAVVVGFDPHFDFRRLATASAAVRGGARFVATNEDATYPTPDGAIPGAGSLVAAVATAAGAMPEVAGKPHDPVVGLLKDRVGRVDLVVGDRPSTDGALALRLGARYGLVLTGVTPPGHGPLEPAPDLEAGTFLELAERCTQVLDAR